MNEADAACTACDLWRTANRQLFIGSGPTDAQIMLVGEAPGREEDASGIPFVGESGQLLDKMLSLIDLPRDTVYVTNAVKCRPPKNRKPTGKEINACRPHLIVELQNVKPELVIALGNEPLKSLTGKSGITAFRGQAQELHKSIALEPRPIVMPTFHPAYALREPVHENEIMQDITTAKRPLAGGFESTVIEWLLFDSAECVVPKNLGIWAVDIETNARDLTDPELAVRFFGIDDGECVYVVMPHQFQAAFEMMAAHQNFVGHNAISFDRAVLLERHAIEFSFHDTQLLAHLVDEEQPLKLQDLVVKYLGVAPWKDDFDVHFWRRGPENKDEWQAAFEYLARDCRYTRLLFPVLWELATPAEQRLYLEHNLPCARALSKIERNGMFISIPNIDKAINETELEQRVTLLMLKQLAGPEFNPASHPQVRELLFSDLMLPVQGKTKAEAASTDEEALKKIRALGLGGNVIPSLLEYRENSKLLGTYLRPWRERATRGYEDKKGIFHPNFTPPYIFPRYSFTATVTGRTSSFDPNAQNVPRDPRVRSMVAAPPGYVLMEADASQLELRMAAELMGPGTALFNEYLKPNPDVHMTMAMRLTGKNDPSMVSKEERSRAKPPNFAYLYYADWQTYQRIALTDYDLVVSKAEARFAQDAFMLWQPQGWWDRTEEELKATGKVTSIFGRSRRLPNIRSRDTYARLEAKRQGINFSDQSASADLVMLWVQTTINRGFHVCGFIHDAMHLLVPDDDAAIANTAAWLRYDFAVTVPQLVESMFGYRFRLPLVADVKAGRHWGDESRSPVPY
jgi:DNA polymerase